MTLLKRGRIWHFDFTHKGQRYQGSTGQTTKADAELVERDRKLDARRRAAGILIPHATDSPRIQDWAETYYEHAARRVDRPERIEDLVRVALRFWGAEPKKTAHPKSAAAPYHDVRLIDVATDPGWIVKWEAWLDAQKPAPHGRTRLWSGQTKNQYRSLLSRMFALAAHPMYRLQTGILSNPFVGVYRDPTYGREVALEVEDLIAILRQASYHLRLAIAIGMLTPKLREGNILALRFDEHLARDYSRITVSEHKTKRHVRRPLVAHVPEQLREILRQARTRTRSPFVIAYRNRRVHELRGAVRGAVERAALERPHLKYGRGAPDGITFHTLRHTAATILADLDVAPEKRQQLMAHRRIDTTMKYTHMRPRHEAVAVEQLSAALPIKDLVLQPWRRPKSLQKPLQAPTELKKKSP